MFKFPYEKYIMFSFVLQTKHGFIIVVDIKAPLTCTILLKEKLYRGLGRMKDIIIDEEFRDLLPVLETETYERLEENLIQNGCRDALVLWNGTLVDGHNRYEICKKHDIPFNTTDKMFDSREEAVIWIITTQVARRNLAPKQLSHYRGVHYRADKKIQGTNNQFAQLNESGHSDHFQGSTANRLAEQYNVSPKTIRRDYIASIATDAIGEVSPVAKRMILSGEINIDKKKLGELSGGLKEEIEEVAISIENGVYKKSKAAAQTSAEQIEPIDIILTGMRRLNTAIGKTADDFSVELVKITNKSGRAKLKTALKSCISSLESLYEQI